MEATEFFQQHARLTPMNCLPAGNGPCACQPSRVLPLYEKSGIRRCGPCTVMAQGYRPGNNRLRGFLLVQTGSVIFWGNADLAPFGIVCRENRGVLRQIIQAPPDPPWMLINFPQRNVIATDLRLTLDNRFPQFSAVTYLDAPFLSFHREQVFRLRAIGLTKDEWRRFILASFSLSPADLETITILEQQYPALKECREIPSYGSTEHRALMMLLTEAEGDS